MRSRRAREAQLQRYTFLLSQAISIHWPAPGAVLISKEA